MSNIPVIDLIFMILIVLMLIHGYVKGFIAEFFSWAALVLAIWGAVILYPRGALFIRGRIMENVKAIPEILAFVAIFLIIMIIVKMVEQVLKDVVNGAKLGGVNKVLGLIFGLIEGFTITALILFILTIQPLFDAGPMIGESIFGQILLPLIRIPFNRGKDVINAAFLVPPEISPLRFIA